MRVKIIANKPPENNLGYSDITQYIGNEYEIAEEDIFKLDPTGKEAMGVFIKELDIEIYDGEFEVISQ